jgi:hypothetical protein
VSRSTGTKWKPTCSKPACCIDRRRRRYAGQLGLRRASS